MQRYWIHYHNIQLFIRCRPLLINQGDSVAIFLLKLPASQPHTHSTIPIRIALQFQAYRQWSIHLANGAAHEHTHTHTHALARSLTKQQQQQ